MANIDSPFGLRATRMISGAPYSGGESSYRIANNYATAIFSGDLVVAVTGGGIEKYDLSAATVPVLGLKQIALAFSDKAICRKSFTTVESFPFDATITDLSLEGDIIILTSNQQ